MEARLNPVVNPAMFWFGVAFVVIAIVLAIIRVRVYRFVYLKWKGTDAPNRSIDAKAWTDGTLTGIAHFAIMGLVFIGSAFIVQPS